MRTRKGTCFAAAAVLVLALAACATTPRILPPVRGVVLAEAVVVVGGGGGHAEVTFSVKAGQKILISMLAEDPGREPYGFLEPPSGEGWYTPEQQQPSSDFNSSEVILDTGGTYTLVVFDGSNEGGPVRVRIEQLE
jgi:hypothetical protein